jgi:hypothetical protein
LEHFEEKAHELGGFFGTSIKASDGFELDGLVDDGLCVEGKALFLPVPANENAISR